MFLFLIVSLCFAFIATLALPTFFHSSTKLPRNARPRKNYPRENGCVPQITLEGLVWVEGLYEEFVLRALSSLGEIIFAW